MSIRTRFTVTVVAIVAITAGLFAGLSILVLDGTLRSSFERVYIRSRPRSPRPWTSITVAPPSIQAICGR